MVGLVTFLSSILSMQLLAVLLATVSLFSVEYCCCNDPGDSPGPHCSGVRFEILRFESLQNALIQDNTNLYRSRKAFFYAPSADPTLLKVKYSITFAENISENVLPHCTNEYNSSISLNQTEIIFGWTSRGLYQWIEPLFLNHIQLMLPFVILRWIHELE